MAELDEVAVQKLNLDAIAAAKRDGRPKPQAAFAAYPKEQVKLAVVGWARAKTALASISGLQAAEESFLAADND